MFDYIIHPFSIILINGDTINFQADKVDFNPKTRLIKLFNDGHIIARFNVDNIAGVVNTDYMLEREV